MLTWKPPVSFGEATVTGYRVLKDGMVFGENIDGETITVTIGDFEKGWFSKKSMLSSVLKG